MITQIHIVVYSVTTKRKWGSCTYREQSLIIVQWKITQESVRLCHLFKQTKRQIKICMHLLVCTQTIYGDEMTLSFKDPRGWPGLLGSHRTHCWLLSLQTLPRTRPLVPPRTPDVKKGRDSVMSIHPARKFHSVSHVNSAFHSTSAPALTAK